MKKFHNHIATAAYEYIIENAEQDDTMLKRHFNFALVVPGRGKTQGKIIRLQYTSQVNSALQGESSPELWRMDHSTRRAFRQ